MEILSSGPANTLQDRGRVGFLDIGVGRGGVMDRVSADVGNALLGNDPEAACLEIAMFPFRARFLADTWLAITGADANARLDGRFIPPNWRFRARARETLELTAPRSGARTYITVLGGFDVPEVLGARCTDLKGGFGGHEGRGLVKGDRPRAFAKTVRKSLGELGALLPRGIADFWSSIDRPTEVRVLAAAETLSFTPESRVAFLDGDWLVSNDANRMGYRLTGPKLELSQPMELFSHGILPGVVQVPPSGQPIIQLAEANTCGGYPKIAVVIDADLWKIAQCGPGSHLRFVEVSWEEAIAARRRLSACLTDLSSALAGW